MKILQLFVFVLIMATNHFLNAQSSSHSDCQNAVVICELGNYHFDTMMGSGQFNDELDQARCLDKRHKESNSLWMTWEVDKSGIMVFTIAPHQAGDDIDFILFKKEIGARVCMGMSDVRCMASGKNLGQSQTDRDCLGNTGLNRSSFDEIEMSGCKYLDDNFLKYLDVEQGERYYLMVNNFDSAKGVSIYFDGTATLLPSETCTEIKSASFDLVDMYPNPVKDKLTIHLYSSIHQSVELILYDLSGKLWKRKSWYMQAGQQLKEMNMADLVRATYLLQIKTDGKTIVKAVVVQ